MTVGDGGIAAATSYFAVYREGAFGSVTGLVGATNATAIEPLSFGIMTEIESQKLETISKNRGPAKRIMGKKSVSGTIEMYLHTVESVHFLMNALGGTTTSSGGSTGVFIHSITGGNFSTAAEASLSMKVRKGTNEFWRYRGGRINQLTISGNVGEPIKIVADMIFMDSSLNSSGDISGSLTLSAIKPLIFTGSEFFVAASVGSMTSTNKEFIESFELTINNNLEEGWVLGTNTVVSLPPKRREVSLKITQRNDTTTAWDRFIAETASAMGFRFRGGSLSSDVFEEIEINMPKVYVNSPDSSVDSPNDILRREFECDVVVDDPMTTTGKDIAMTVKNGVTSY